jgi:hypothetical protein
MELLEMVQDDARRRISGEDVGTSNLYIENEILQAGELIQMPDNEISIEIASVMVFVDEDPTANWAHDCRYMLYNAEDGELYKELPARFPPYLVHEPGSFEMFHEAVRLETDLRMKAVEPSIRFVHRKPRGNRYAVLFSGASNFRHVNDLEFLYRTLVDIYGFRTDNIYVLNYDGSIDWAKAPYTYTNWPGDDTPHRMPVNGAGTKSELEGVFNDLKTRLRSDDLLLIHTNNHGGHGSESFLCSYSGSDYLASDFAAKLAELPKFRCLIGMFEQCHSGGFIVPVILNSPATRTSVATACTEYHSSYGCGSYDCFARDWIAAVNGHEPSGGALASNPDLDADGCICAKEAYDYADKHKFAWDTPLFSQDPIGSGECHLGQLWQAWYPPWYKKILYEQPPVYQPPLPDPELYEQVHERLAPELADIELIMAERYLELDREMYEEFGPRIEEIWEETFGYSPHHRPEPIIG